MIKNSFAKKTIALVKICCVVIAMTVVSHFILSFTVARISEDVFKQMGITKINADQKIINSVLGGYLDQQGVRNARNIATGNRAAIAKDLLAYTKQQVSGAAFMKEYNALRESNKPTPNKVQTPEEMRENMINEAKKSVAETEATLKKADASLKPVFQQVLETSKKYLKDVEDPNNKQIASYTKNYDQLLKSTQQGYEQELNRWNEKYPADPKLFVKGRLQQFLDETSNIDFDAELMVKNGKKIFVNTQYERKSNRWKMAYRAGKEVIEPARDFVQKWIEELK